MIRETLFGPVALITDAVNLLRAYEPPEGYELALSGKDSYAVYHLCRLAGVKFTPTHNDTTIEPPELLDFLRTVPDIKIIRPAIGFFRLMIARGFPSRHGRWCCSDLKERTSPHRLVLTGVRKQESVARSRRKTLEVCAKKGKRLLHPILDWTTDEVWRFHAEHNLPHCSLYDEGYHRVGCIACPMQSGYIRQLELIRWPVYEQAYRVAFRKLYARRKAEGNQRINRWTSGDAMFEWWMCDDPTLLSPGQSSFSFLDNSEPPTDEVSEARRAH